MLVVLLSILSMTARAESTFWQLTDAKVSYEVNHPMHKVIGTSTAAKGRGNCDKTSCEFLVAAPVKTFDSENSNRDMHMLEIVHGYTHPMAAFSCRIPIDQIKTGTVKSKCDVELNGEKTAATVPIQLQVDQKITATGEIPLLLSTFKVERPSLLGVAVKDSFVIRFQSTWTK